MANKKLNLTTLIFLLSLGFFILNFYNAGNLTNSNFASGCQQGSGIRCAEAKFTELKENLLWQELNEQNSGEKTSLLEKYQQSYGQGKTLQNIATAKLEKQKIEYHQKVLEILENLPASKQKKLCKDNLNFIAKNQVEAKIQAICNQVGAREMVQGVDSKEDEGSVFFNIPEIP